MPVVNAIRFLIGISLTEVKAVRHPAGGLASSGNLVLFAFDALQYGTKYLPVDDGVEPLQWVAGLAQARISVVKV